VRFTIAHVACGGAHRELHLWKRFEKMPRNSCLACTARGTQDDQMLSIRHSALAPSCARVPLLLQQR
jgi:hypothetical protein